MKKIISSLIILALIVGACPCSILRADICKPQIDKLQKSHCHSQPSDSSSPVGKDKPRGACCGKLILELAKSFEFSVDTKSLDSVDIEWRELETQNVFQQVESFSHDPPGQTQALAFYQTTYPSHAPPACVYTIA